MGERAVCSNGSARNDRTLRFKWNPEALSRGGVAPVAGRAHFWSLPTFDGAVASNWIMAFASL
jgi:hypothetical protein